MTNKEASESRQAAANEPEVTPGKNVEHPEVMNKASARQPDTVNLKVVQHTDTSKNEIVLDMEKDGKIYIFNGKPDGSAPAVEFIHVLAAGAAGPDPHIHTKQTETFHVVSGTMVARVKGQEDVTLGPGEKITVPPGKTHTFSNGSMGDPLELRIVVEPALDFQWFMTEAVKSGLRNGGRQKDMPLLEAGHLMWLSRDQQRIGGMPYFMQDALFGILSLVARITGKAGNIAPKP